MKIIVGLGNPGKEYENTKHNLGFMFLDFLNKNYLGGEFKTFKNSKIIEGNIDNEKVILAKPQTYMNLSGDAVIKLKNWYKVDNNDILVIYDDFDIPFESVRYRDSGSAGTHNGMKSVVHMLKTEKFTRLRVGIGMPERKSDLINYVIGHVNDEEYNELLKGVSKAEKAITELLENGIDIAMNKYNNV